MLHTEAFSLVLFSWLREIGAILLLIGLSGEVALLVLGISKGAWERGLAIAFAALVLSATVRNIGPIARERSAPRPNSGLRMPSSNFVALRSTSRSSLIPKLLP